MTIRPKRSDLEGTILRPAENTPTSSIGPKQKLRWCKTKVINDVECPNISFTRLRSRVIVDNVDDKKMFQNMLGGNIGGAASRTSWQW